MDITFENHKKKSISDVLKLAQLRVERLMKKVEQEAHRNFLIAVDGSKESDSAYEVNLASVVLFITLP